MELVLFVVASLLSLSGGLIVPLVAASQETIPSAYEGHWFASWLYPQVIAILLVIGTVGYHFFS